jgi:hypothetical protein
MSDGLLVGGQLHRRTDAEEPGSGRRTGPSPFRPRREPLPLNE